MEETMEARNEGENLLLRRTQTDLLQKLRQLQQWRQQQEEHLLQDKEKQMNLLRDKERRLHAVQEYQRKVLENSNFVTSGTDNPSFQEKSAGFPEGQSLRPLCGMQSNGSVTTSVTLVPMPRLNQSTRTVLLSPQHFKTSLANRNPTHVSPSTTKPQNQMLLTQKLQLPSAGDEELSQFTESDGGSIGDIEGIRPIEDTSSEISGASLQEEDDIDYGAHDTDNEDINNETLVNDDDDNGDDDCDNGIDDIDDGGDNDNAHDDDEYKEDTNDQALGCDSLPHHDVRSKPSFDDIPIKPGLGAQTKTFEEMLNQQLQEEQNRKPEEPSRSQTIFSTKRSFLKKGEGIARFGMKPKTGTEPVSTTTDKDIKVNFVEQRAPVTRKTASVKQSAVVKQSGPTKQSASFTRKSFQHNTDQGKQPFSPKKVQFSTGQSVFHGTEVFTGNELEDRSSECTLDYGNIEGVGNLAAGSEVIIEDSFQEKMKKWDELEVVEKLELNEFELLEEAAAANCSLSSNSSTVLRILGKKQQQHGADVNNNMLGVRQKWNVPAKDKETVESDSDANRTLTEENLDDEHDDTLKDPEVISVRSSLALSDGFDDTKTWDDHDALDVSDVTDDVMHALNTSTPDAKGQRSSHAQKRVNISSTPPTSALVTKLFPQLKAKNETSKSQVNQKQPQHIKPQSSASTDVVASSVQENDMNGGMSSAVRDKLNELEKEIEKFREENIALHKLREQREKDLRELEKERALFENYKTEELERLEKFKNEEERRLRRDKRVFEQYQEASRALPDKKEREEITTLRAKISELQEELKLRESRWSAAATRYKDRINNVEKENREMKDEVKLLEKQNLDLQRREQQRTRELQQYKAFEKKKLKKPEEISSEKSPPNNVAQTTEQRNEDSPSEDKTLDNVRVGIKKQAKSASDTHPLHAGRKTVSPPERKKTVNNADIIETQGIDGPDGSESAENASSAPERLQNHSPPTKHPGSSKSVRFKDDIQEEEKPPEFLPKLLSHSDGKREVINQDGSRVVTFTNGTRKEISADGLSVVVTFFNGDIKQIFPDERVEYYYAEVQTTHTTYPDGLEVLRFPSNQIEKHYPDGTKEIIFPDQTVKYLYTSGSEECVFTDGTVERISVDGERIVEFPNGQRETYTKLFKKREYPDGTVKTVYTDGRQETRYASGRLRVKDGEGRLLVDTAEQNIQAQNSAV